MGWTALGHREKGQGAKAGRGEHSAGPCSGRGSIRGTKRPGRYRQLPLVLQQLAQLCELVFQQVALVFELA
ncbi:hypothetical protein AO265_02500 [Pseudomonas sp. ABAC61]|nr:hypothetical protein AO265_02500 [Pseudomonas sp. ABAC61]